ncbi:hypothetical protein [Pseudomonas protegens]|uniref:hypothetical protein n=1 Tax=Pseudomonas protegens TaxID=380021 RepID=UPI0017C490D7|nr:hypothetical protein [Pseudomonas protegens]
MHDLRSFAAPLESKPEAPAVNPSLVLQQPVRRAMKSALVATLAALGLSGCVGAWVDMPYMQVSKTDAHQRLIGNSMKPVITHTQKSTPERQWCGTTLLVVILPIPLKLPVCESYSATAYGDDINGVEVPLLYTNRKISSDLYACGPLMFLGPIAHGYQGNAVCGVFR